MNELIDNHKEEKICQFEDEIYSVRDNGAIMRHPKTGTRTRKWDLIWTFGTPDKKTGYMFIAGVRVHRIVATAFLGEPPSKDHRVDHINTNRHDNRPENLRWVTRLENIILNPITCKKLVWKTGKSIDYILQHIEILHDTDLEPDISWMRTVTEEESKNCYENLLHWAHEDNVQPSEKRGVIGEWIYQKRFFAECNEDHHLVFTRTPTAVHNKNRMKLPSEYPCCPTGDGEHSLEEYFNNLEPGKVYLKTDYYQTLVEETAMHNDSIIIRTKSADKDAVKKFAVSTITLVNNIFVHELYRTCFVEESSRKYFTVLQGKEWTGGDVFDDFC